MAKKANESPLIENDDDFEIDEESGKVVYVLVLKNEARGRVYDMDGNPVKDPEYQRARNLLMRSSINWPGGADPFTGKDRRRGRYLIRYYDGCTTLFVDDQPKEASTLEPLIMGTREFNFINGHFSVDDYDTMLKTYCDWCSWNAGSPYRNKRSDAIFKLLDTEEMRRQDATKMDMLEKAMEMAKNAPVKHMRIHAKFLKVMDIDSQTHRPLSDEAIRIEYRKAAQHNSEEFIRTFNDKSIHIKHWIELGISSGEISTTLIPNRAVWAKRGVEICDLSGLQTSDGILNKLIEYAQTDAGIEFKAHLESLYKSR